MTYLVEIQQSAGVILLAATLIIHSIYVEELSDVAAFIIGGIFAASSAVLVISTLMRIWL